MSSDTGDEIGRKSSKKGRKKDKEGRKVTRRDVMGRKSDEK